MPIPAAAAIPPSGGGGLNVVIFGSSTDAHCHITLDGTLWVDSNNRGHWQFNGSNHALLTGTRCFVGINFAGTAPGPWDIDQDRRAIVTITVTGNNTVESI